VLGVGDTHQAGAVVVRQHLGEGGLRRGAAVAGVGRRALLVHRLAHGELGAGEEDVRGQGRPVLLRAGDEVGGVQRRRGARRGERGHGGLGARDRGGAGELGRRSARGPVVTVGGDDGHRNGRAYRDGGERA